MKDDPKSVFIRHPDAAFRTIQGLVVIVNTLTSRILRLNETGSAIWKLLDGRDVGEISRSVAEEFRVEQEKAAQDVLRFLQQMQDRGLVMTRQVEAK